MRKASVSIVFNNGERETSPPGFEHCPTITVTRQVAVGGRTKYLINGHVKQQRFVFGKGRRGEGEKGRGLGKGGD